MKIGGLRGLVPAAARWGVVRPSALAAVALAALAFCAPASAAERSLAGIRIFSASRTVLQKFKSPTRVIVGRPSLCACRRQRERRRGRGAAPRCGSGRLPARRPASCFGGGVPSGVWRRRLLRLLRTRGAPTPGRVLIRMRSQIGANPAK